MPRDPRVRELLMRYEELREQGRPAAPEELCRDTPELLDDLRRGIADLDALQGRLGPLDTEGGPPTVPAGRLSESSLPAFAGRYEIEGEIARGGMGEVWRARDPELNRTLAIKVMRSDYAGRPESRRRFLEEAQVTGQLQHPGIPPVHEVGTLPDGRPFFAMKLIRGRTLADLLDQRGAPAADLPRFVGIFEQVCQAVAYAHSKGVIHRDLKPANVMVGAFGEVQVMDWGLAKVLGRPDGELPPIPVAASAVRTVRSGSPGAESRPGSVLGTPAYMAPEQALGEVARLDRRSDVFGLGAILCEVLTGRPPYVAPDGDAAWRQAARADLAGAFARLDDCGADGELVGLAKGCLAAEPGDRPADAGAVAGAVAAYQEAVRERLREAELGRAAAQARAEEAKATAAAERKARRRARALAAALLALVAAGAAGGLLWQRQARRDAEQRQAVEFALQRAAELRQQARWGEARAVLEQARQGLGDGGPADLRRRLDEARDELALVNRLDGARLRRATWVEGHFDKQTAARDYAAAFREAGLGQVGDDVEAVAQRVRASGVAGPLVAALDEWASFAPQGRESWTWLLEVAKRADPDPWRAQLRDPAVRGDQQALRALAEEALRDGGAKLDQLSPPLLVSLGRLLGDAAEAVPLLRAAQRRYPNDFWLNLELGNALHEAKQFEEAVGYYRVAMALRPDAAAAHNNLGNALHAKGDQDGAIAEYRQAIALGPQFAFAHNGLGSVLKDKGDVDGGIAKFRQAIALDPKLALAHSNLGNALHDKGDQDGAIAEYREAIALDLKSADAHNGLGLVLEDKGDVDGAIAEFRQAIALDPKFAPAHNNLGIALRKKGDVDSAIAEFRQALALDPKLALLAHSNLGVALRDKGDLDGAVAEFRQAIALDPKDAPVHYNLGYALHKKGNLDGAITEYRKAIDINPDLPEAHCNLGHALREQGRFAEALAELRRGDALGRPRPGWPYPSADWVRQCERLVALDARLPAILAGEAEPAGAPEQLAVAQLCWQYKRLCATAARSYAAAFAPDPRLAADLKQQHRYNAACCAALAAAGRAEDAKALPDKVRLMLRRQALAWLRDDLAAYAQLAERDDPAARGSVRRRLAHWQQDADLASVRDPQALDLLLEDERRPWRQLWDDVAALLKKAQAVQ
jgi:serine/threonine-protein kinase